MYDIAVIKLALRMVSDLGDTVLKTSVFTYEHQSLHAERRTTRTSEEFVAFTLTKKNGRLMNGSSGPARSA